MANNKQKSRSNSHASTVTPTMQQVMIETPQDVLILLQLVLIDQFKSTTNSTTKSTTLPGASSSSSSQVQYPLCYKRLDEMYVSKLCTHGNVFIFKEQESKMKRWTDKLNWCPSRIVMNKFLVYKQIVYDSGSATTDSQTPQNNTTTSGGGGSSSSSSSGGGGEKMRKRKNSVSTGLCKKTISVKYQNDVVHIVFYYNEKDQYGTVSDSTNSVPTVNITSNSGTGNNRFKTLTELYGEEYTVADELVEAMESCNIGVTSSDSNSNSRSRSNSTASSVSGVSGASSNSSIKGNNDKASMVYQYDMNYETSPLKRNGSISKPLPRGNCDFNNNNNNNNNKKQQQYNDDIFRLSRTNSVSVASLASSQSSASTASLLNPTTQNIHGQNMYYSPIVMNTATTYPVNPLNSVNPVNPVNSVNSSNYSSNNINVLDTTQPAPNTMNSIENKYVYHTSSGIDIQTTTTNNNGNNNGSGQGMLLNHTSQPQQQYQWQVPQYQVLQNQAPQIQFLPNQLLQNQVLLQNQSLSNKPIPTYLLPNQALPYQVAPIPMQSHSQRYQFQPQPLQTQPHGQPHGQPQGQPHGQPQGQLQGQPQGQLQGQEPQLQKLPSMTELQLPRI